MRKVNPLQACGTEKARYDSCFKEWYRSRFLKVSFVHILLSVKESGLDGSEY